MLKCGITGSSGNLGKTFLKHNQKFNFIKFKGDISKRKEIDYWIKKNDFQILIHFAALVPTLVVNQNYKHALKMNADERWNYVFKLASSVNRCGEDSHDGCGCLQPKKFKKEGLATLFAEWDNVNGLDLEEDKEKLTMKLTPEIILKIFKRISDDDVNFMGFSPVFSRPDWMICQVLAVPPPSVRPSIKMDGQQRSEDDISHILVNIIKANKTLLEKMQENANSNIIDDWHTVLQYYVATQVDNKIPGVASVAQRSGRPLKSIKER